MTIESGSIIPVYGRLYIDSESFLPHLTKYLQIGNNICDSYKYQFKVPRLTWFDLQNQGNLFYNSFNKMIINYIKSGWYSKFLPLKSIFVSILCCQNAFKIIQNLLQFF